MLFYRKITEKLKLVFNTADEIISLMKSLVLDILESNVEQIMELLANKDADSSLVNKLSSRINAEQLVEDIFWGLHTMHLRKKYVSEFQTCLCKQDWYCQQLSLLYSTHQAVGTHPECRRNARSFIGATTTIKGAASFRRWRIFHRTSGSCKNVSHNTIFLFLYTNELEINNPLGSAAGRDKNLVVYFSILNLHPRHRSKLNCIHLLLMDKYLVVLQCGLDVVLARMVQDLNCARKGGVDVNDVHFHVVTVACTGDNLSMHRFAGLQCSFSSGRVCRFCLAHHRQPKVLHSITDCVERTSRVHKSYLEAFALDRKVNGPLYGISCVSPLQKLTDFDVIKQLPPDAMHDIFEGGITCILQHIPHGLVWEGVLYKTDLNRVTALSYGFHDKKSAPVTARVTFLSGKGNLRGTANQKWCLFRMLPQLYEDTIPEDNPHWMAYLADRDLADTILASKISEDCITYLQVKVQEFLELFTTQYPNAALIPKLHFLLHYPKYIRKFGAPRRFWGMRFEAKHSYFKGISSKVKNFRNICMTLATRHQPLQAYDLSGNIFDESLVTTAAKSL